MSKHTPGPWDWFEGTRGPYLATPNRGRLYVMSFARSGMQGATPRFAHWDGIEGGTERERMGGIMCDGVTLPSGDLHPDAKLIAAAPELLEACKTMAEWFCREHEGFANAGEVRTTPEGEAAWREWWEENLRLCALAKTQANAAIAKATA